MSARTGIIITQAPPEMIRRLRQGSDLLATAVMKRVEAEVAWYRHLPAEDRSWIGLIAQSGIAAFIGWYERPESSSLNAVEIFRNVPAELTRTISLQNTLQLVRITVEVVEANSGQLASPGQERDLREAVLVYSREVAFSAAEVYARAAEARGAWDARLEALVVDSLLHGSDDEDAFVRTRVTALGWATDVPTITMAGTANAPLSEMLASELRRAAHRAADHALVGIQGHQLIIVLGSARPSSSALALLPKFGDGPVVLGPEAPSVLGAGRSARIALAGLAAVRAWPSAPRPTRAQDLLPERVLAGDPQARATLLEDVYAPLLGVGGPLLETLSVYLDQGRSLEATARLLYVHPNTVRYRLRRIATVTGWDATDAREGYVLQVAIALGRLRG